MDFYLKDDTGKTIATFEYFTSTKECDICKAIVVKKGSLMSKGSYCKERWDDCKWIEDDRQAAIENAVVEDYDNDYYLIKEDLMFKSPVKAASIILGHIETDAWNIIVNEKAETLQQVYRT